MDTTTTPVLSSSDASTFSCAPAALAEALQRNDAPLIIDVRKNKAFSLANDTLPGALRRDPSQIDSWADTLPAAAAVLVYCVHGHEVSQNIMSALRARSVNAQFLQGGIEAWRELGLPLTLKPAPAERGEPKYSKTA